MKDGVVYDPEGGIVGTYTRIVNPRYTGESHNKIIFRPTRPGSLWENLF